MTLTYSPQEFAGQLSSYSAEEISMDPMWSVCGIRLQELRMVHQHLQSTCTTRWSRWFASGTCTLNQPSGLRVSELPLREQALPYDISNLARAFGAHWARWDPI